MTEQEWLGCDDPRPMQQFLGGNPGLRKMRLFVLACCRQIWGAAADPPTRVALQSVERFVQAGAMQTWKASVRVASGQAVIDCRASDPLGPLQVFASNSLPRQVSVSAVPPILVRILEYLACERDVSWWPDWLIEALDRAGLSPARQADVFRDLIRAPFRPLHFRAAWRTGNDGASLQVARVIDHEEAFDQVPILADALEDSGCDCDEILDHLRHSEGHVRGCWAVDLVLGRW
jgi:hypothetical protein